jgi:Asp-tRNA(Asn)/Glu-tRNA(Gln) amidotransferase A subunit family amidase
MPTDVNGVEIRPMRAVAFTYPFNLTGNAAASVPCGISSEGLPIGLQIVCRRFEEERVLELGAVLEQIRPWPRLAPGS